MHTSRQFTLKAISKVQQESSLTNRHVKPCHRERKDEITMKLKTRYTLKTIALLLGLLTVLTFSQEARAATFNIADGDVAGLIAAINAANSNPGPDTINLAQGGTYTLTYIAGPDSWHGPTGLPIVQGFSETQHESLTINGNGSTIRRSDAPGIPEFRIFHALYADVVLDGLVIKGGRGYGSRCGGGGLYLNVSNTVLRNSTITDNFGVEGGGICNNNASTLTIENSTISHNTGSGGEILNLAAASLSIINTTIYDDQADANRTDSIVDAFSPPGSILIKNSIVAGPTGGTGIDCYGFTPVSLGHNIFNDGTCGQNVAGGDLIVPTLTLEPLGNNGGGTPTHAFLSSSAALDAIPVSDCTNVAGIPILFDQRGISRPQGARCDIGAYELVSVAGPPTYDNRATWANALCSTETTKTIDFSHKDDGSFITTPAADTYFETLTLSGVTFHQVQSYFNQLIYYFPTAVIKSDLPPGTYSLATDLFAGYGMAGTFTVTLSTGQTYFVNTDGTSRFFGVISSTPIEWASFSFNNNYLVIDNFTVGTGCDSTAPVITPTVTGTLGNNGWYTSDVDVSWSVTDPESSVSSSTGCDTTSVSTDTDGITFTCNATSGGGSSSESVTVKRDATAPLVSCGSADGAWHSSDVSIACMAGDATSQLANGGDASFSLTTSVSAGTETANAMTGSHNVFDNAGNVMTAGPINNNKVDQKAPTITITNPTNALYFLNQSKAANFGCVDGGAGVATCNGTAPNGNNINTASTGTKAFTVVATDNAGNSSSQSVNYSVTTALLTNLAPSQVWVGLKNSDDVGTKFDLLAEVLKNGMVVGSGQVDGVTPGSSGFNNAVLRGISLSLSGTQTFAGGDNLAFRLSVRVAANSNHVSGTARLWFNDAAANSSFGATVNEVINAYYLRSGSALAVTTGTGPKNTIDVTVNRNQNGNPFKPFATWIVTF